MTPHHGRRAATRRPLPGARSPGPCSAVRRSHGRRPSPPSRPFRRRPGARCGHGSGRRRSRARRGRCPAFRRRAATGCPACRVPPASRSAVRRTRCGQVAVEQRRGQLLGEDRGHRGPAHPVLLAVRVVGREDDSLGGDLGLVDRRDRLRVPREPRQHPGELRRVDGRHLHDGDPHVAPVMHQLGADRLGEAVDRVLRAAVRGLQRDRPVAERGPDLDDRAAVAGHHAAQRRHRAVHVAQVGDLGDPPELRRGDLGERGEHRGEPHVHPHVDRAELAFRPLGGPVDGLEVGHVRGQRQRRAAQVIHRVGGTAQPVFPPRDQRHAGAAAAEKFCRRPPDPGACPGDHHCLARVRLPVVFTLVHVLAPFSCRVVRSGTPTSRHPARQTNYKDS